MEDMVSSVNVCTCLERNQLISMKIEINIFGSINIEMDHLREKLDQHLKQRKYELIVSVYGSTEEYIGITEQETDRNRDICQELGYALKKITGLLLLTGGTTGVPRRVTEAYGQEETILQVLPTDYQDDLPKIGTTLRLGSNMEERRRLIGQYPKIAIVISGGPGTVQEASLAFNSGALVLLVSSSGGAASGCKAFEFPDRRKIKLSLDAKLSIENRANLENPDVPPKQIAKTILEIIKSY